MKSINYSFSDLVDTDKIKDLLASFYDLTGILSVLEDLDGNILTCADRSGVAVGWQDICLNFHRKHPETLKKCIESDTKLSNGLKAGERYSCYTCLNGMVDMAVPIYIGGEHLANLFTGQFFLELSDIEFIRKQAHKYGFDEEEYLNVLSKVPVFPAEFIERSMSFLTDLASVIGEMGLEKKKLLDSKLVLQESEERYRIISQNTGDVIWLLDANSGQFIYISPSVKNLRGYNYNKVLGQNIKDVLTLKSYKIVKDELMVHIAAFLSGDESARVMVHSVDQICKDGSIVPTEVVTTLLTNEEGHVDRVLGVSRDISDRKMTEKQNQKLMEDLQQFAEELEVSNEELQVTTEELMASNEELQATTEELQVANEELKQQGDELIQLNQTLRENKERYRALAENSPDLIFRIDKKLRFLYGNHGSSTLELSIEDLIGKNFKELPLSEEMMNVLVENINTTIDTGEIKEIEFEFPSIHGSRCFHSHIIPEHNAEGEIETLLIVNRDVTKRKNAEKQIKMSEAYYRAIFENTGTATIIVEEDTTISLVNAEFEKLYGYLKEEVECKKSWGEFVSNDYLRKMEEYHNLRRIDPNLAPRNYEFKFVDRYGNVKDILTTVAMIPGTEKSLISLLDITENKKAEKALSDSEKHLRMITDNMVDLVSQTDVNGIIEYVSPSGKILLGYEPEELIGTLIFDYVHPNDLEEVKKAFTMAFVKVESGRVEIRFKHANGHYIWLEIVGDLLFDENHLIKGAVFGARDAGARKKVEKQIKRSEAYYRTIFENTGTATIIVEEDTTISLVNAEFEKLYGYLKEEVEGKKSWKEFVVSDYIPKMEKYHNFRRIDPNLAPRNYEFKFSDRYGNVKDVLTTVAMIPGTEKSLISLLDITDNKIAENKIKESLKEKEILLKEIHHRVKNNLQIVSSLLNLQARCVEEEETINVLKESQNRVKTMAMVHEKLYQSEDLKDINFKEYIENLVLDLFYSYGVEIGTIEPQIHVEDLKIGIDTAIPCGLIINELVTNSLKYAFPANFIRGPAIEKFASPNRKWMIKVELKQLKDKLELIVFDNGVGLPEEIEMENIETLGLKMVKILVDQLKGTLELDRNGGTKFKIIFEEL